MQVYRRFFIVKSNPVFDHVQRCIDQNKEVKKVWDKLCKDVGASQMYFNTHTGGFNGFDFKMGSNVDHDLYTYRKRPGAHFPRKGQYRNAEVKAKAQKLNELVEALPRFENECSALQHADMDADNQLSMFNPIFENNRIYHACVSWFITDGELSVFVSTPWADVDPNQPKPHKALEWIPPSDWVELKEWEVQKLFDEHKARGEPA